MVAGGLWACVFWVRSDGIVFEQKQKKTFDQEDAEAIKGRKYAAGKPV